MKKSFKAVQSQPFQKKVDPQKRNALVHVSAKVLIAVWTVVIFV